MVSGNAFLIQDTSMIIFFTPGAYRYARVIIPQTKTPEGYYQLGTMVLCASNALDSGWSVGYQRPTRMGHTLLEAPGGGLTSAIGRAPRLEFGLTYKNQDLDGDVLAVARYAAGYAMVLVPDADAARPLPHLVYLRGDVEQVHAAQTINRYDVDIELIEIP
jgi:hypothetical protein